MCEVIFKAEETEELQNLPESAHAKTDKSLSDREAYGISPLKKSEHGEWLAFCNRILGDGHDRLRRCFLAAPEGTCGQVLAVREGGKIVSCARFCVRQAFIYDTIYKLGIIGDVATDEEYRGRGMASALLSEITSGFIENNVVMSIMRSPDSRLPESLGWSRLSMFNRVVDKAYLRKTLPAKKINASEHIDIMKLLHFRYTKNQNGCPDRRDEYSDRCIFPCMENVYGVFYPSGLVGYAIFKGNECTELAAPRKYRQSLLCACPADENNHIRVSTEIHLPVNERIENSKRGLMIHLNLPIYIKNAYMSDSEVLSAYLQENKFTIFPADEL